MLLKDKGIQVINELGDIKIKCRKLTLSSDKNTQIEAKKVNISTDDSLTLNSSSGTGINSDKNVNIKGNNIKITGSQGVTAEGKQIAVQGDKVMGMDIHIMVVPAGLSTANVPLPHPFIGQLKDELSKDVKIGGKNAATKDSVAKHDDSTHMQLPGTIKFQSNPSKDGKVSNGTSKKVKIDGKEAAVIGSTVSTSNDMGMKDNSTIMAMGMTMPMPKIINPLNTESYKKEKQEAEKKQPEFTTVKWSTSSTDEGSEAELSASVKDIADGNMVTLQVFNEGKGPTRKYVVKECEVLNPASQEIA